MTLEDLNEIFQPELLMPQFEAAILGVADRFGMESVVCYDKGIVLDILAKSFAITEEDLSKEEIADGLTLEEKKYDMAVEWFDYNVIGAWLGEYTPVFVTTKIA